MSKYCFDTSGISTPYELMPEDIHTSMWDNVREFISEGNVAVTTEIYDEMVNIGGELGEFLKIQKVNVVHEINADGWDWERYIEHSTRMQNEYYEYISEYCGGLKRLLV